MAQNFSYPSSRLVYLSHNGTNRFILGLKGVQNFLTDYFLASDRLVTG